jgi:hypothetical protein
MVPSEKAIAEGSLESEQLIKMMHINKSSELKNFF